MILGYAVSGLVDDNARLQIEQLNTIGCGAIFVDKGSATGDRPELEKLIAQLLPGDVVAVTGVERLAGGLTALLTVLARLAEAKAELLALDGTVDTRVPGQAQFYATAALLAACERRMAVERMRAGRAQARSRGLRLGRRPKLNADQIAHGRKLLALGESGRAVARTLGISEATLYRHLKQSEVLP